MKAIIKLISVMGVTGLFLGYSSAALGSDLGKTVESNLKDVSAVGVFVCSRQCNLLWAYCEKISGFTIF